MTREASACRRELVAYGGSQKSTHTSEPTALYFMFYKTITKLIDWSKHQLRSLTVRISECY